MISAEKIRKIIVAVVIFALLGGVVGVLFIDSSARSGEQQKLAAFENDTRALISKRLELELEYANIERVALDKLENGSYIGLLFSEIDKELYTLFSYHFKGKLSYGATMCLSPGAMPGDDGCISLIQFYEMLLADWQYAVYWDGEGELSEYLAAAQSEFAKYGISFPDTVAFKSGTYTAMHDGVLSAYGIKNVLHHGEESRKLIEKSVKEQIWRPGVLSWNTIGYSNAMLIEVINHGGIAFFEVNFSGGSEINYDPNNPERVEGFGRMLATIQNCINNDEIEVTDLTSAKIGRANYLSCEEEAMAYVDMRRAEIVKELNQIELDITNKYNEYFG